MSALLLSRLVPSKSQNLAESALDLAEMPPFLRVLLTTDGTVTRSLEAFFWEPVDVKVNQHELVELQHDVPQIERQAGMQVLMRRIELRGQQSDTLYGWAESLIREELLPLKVRDDLRAQRLGIGELLRECGLETYREVLDIGLDGERDDVWVWRTYRIVMAQQPLILITEQFPLSVFQ
ncbi:Chorismate pyruvate-lyase [Thalassocella blandensis]|nr:Chorismate pyruvate-lyase [Thalassocella blandensis]